MLARVASSIAGRGHLGLKASVAVRLLDACEHQAIELTAFSMDKSWPLSWPRAVRKKVRTKRAARAPA